METSVEWQDLIRIFEVLLIPFAVWLVVTLDKILTQSKTTMQVLIGVEGGNGRDGLIYRIEKLEKSVRRLELMQEQRHSELPPEEDDD